jgi:hypothetical protein
MVEYLLSFSKFALLVNVGALLIYQLLANKRTAFTVIVATTSILGAIHIGWEILLMSMAEDESKKPLVRNLWYIGFAASDFAVVSLCSSVCKKMKLKLDRICQFIIFTYVAFGFIQLLRYADRIVLKTDVLGWFYSAIIPALNLGIMTAVFAYLLITLLSTLKKHFGF